MSRKHIFTGRWHKGSGAKQVDPSRKIEERLVAALASIRRVGDHRHNPLSLPAAIDRVCDVAVGYLRWRESRTIIRDIILRLSDGSEIKVDKATPTNTNLFGFRFRSSFPPGSVLNVYKSADHEFPEVLLYSIALDRIPVDGLAYTVTYENGQMLMLKVDPSLPRQFQISVDYTMRGDVISIPPSPLRPPFKLLPGLAQVAALCLLATMAVITWHKYAEERGNPAGGASATETEAAPTRLVMRQVGSPNDQARPSSSADLDVTEQPRAQGPQVTSRQSNSTTGNADFGDGLDYAVTPPKARAQLVPAATGNASTASRRRSRIERPTPAAAAWQYGAVGSALLTAGASRNSQIPVYIKVWTGDEKVDERVEKVFADELASTNHFNVLTGDDSVPLSYYEVNLWFAHAGSRGGTIYYELHEANTSLIQVGERDCDDIKQRSLIESVSQQLAREVMSKIDLSVAANIRFELRPPRPLAGFEGATRARPPAIHQTTDNRAVPPVKSLNREGEARELAQ